MSHSSIPLSLEHRLEALALIFDGALLPAAHDLPRFIALGLFGMFGNQARPNIYIRRSLQLVPQRTA